MSREILIGRKDDGHEERYLLEVFLEGQHWASTLVKLDESGNPEPVKVAPRFYGLTAGQARRRMVSVLENQYPEVRSAAGAGRPRSRPT
jgi:hypothetical protein